MAELAIRVEGIGKEYNIAAAQEHTDSFRELVTNAVTSPFRRAGNLLRGHATGAAELDETFWAVRNISFDVERGEVIGLIGHNGAGKSTMLKILARITEPTEGSARIYGRVASLLEVGTGFHKELTGRENIFLNGSILGMARAEIKRKFDEIVDFAEVERFIDTPVKHYSTGMRVRLAFSVAAHLEPEILLIDEVLSVGDAGFQRKCLGKMNEVAGEGRTIIFVSHDMGAITQLCAKAIALQGGQIVDAGPSHDVVHDYLAGMLGNYEDKGLNNADQRSGNGRIRITDAYLKDPEGRRTDTPIGGYPVEVVFAFEAAEDMPQVQFTFTIFNDRGTALTMCHVDAYGERYDISEGRGVIQCRIENLSLSRGRYRVLAEAYDVFGNLLDEVPIACSFDVASTNFFPTQYSPKKRSVAFYTRHRWAMGEGAFDDEPVAAPVQHRIDGANGHSPTSKRAS